MRLNPKAWRILALVLFGSWFIHKQYRSAQEDFFLDGLIYLFIATCGLIAFAFAIYQDKKEYRQTKRLTSYLPTMTGVVIIAVISGFSIYQYARTNSPTLISGFYDGGFNGFKVDFKNDGNYIMANGTGLGQSYYYGKYSLTDSIITLDTTNIENVVVTKQLVIRNVTGLSRHGLYIIQLDEGGHDLDATSFRVTEDNRAK